MANSESNVGARLFLIGKAGVLSGIKEIQLATARLNAEIAAGAKSSKVAGAAQAEQMAGLTRLGTVMQAYHARNAAAADAVASVGKKAFWGIAASAALAGYESIKWASQYQTQLTRLRTQAGLTVSAMNAVGRAAMANSAGLGISPTTYVQAAYHPASTGMNVAQTIAITNASAKLAGIGGSDIEDTTNAVTGIIKNYNFKGKNSAANTAALVNAIVGAGNMHMADFNAAAASGVFATAKTFGISPQATGGALAYMTDRGVPASQAGTHLRMAMALLGAPSHIAQKFLTDAGMSKTQAQDSTNALAQTLKAAGLSTTSLSSDLRNNKGGGGIYNALADLKRHLAASGMSPELQAAFISRSFGGGKMGTTVEMMYNNVAGVGQKTQQIDRNSQSSAFMKDWAAYTQTAAYRTKALSAEVHTLGIALGKDLLPPAMAVVGAMTSVLTFFGHNKVAAIALGTALTALLVPAIGVYLYRALLGNGSALRLVAEGYGNLIRGQPIFRGQLAETDASLTAATGATYRLAAADEALGGAAATAGGRTALGGLAGDLGGAGRLGRFGGLRGMIGKGAGALGIAGLGIMGGQIIAGKAGMTLNDHASTSNKVRSVLGAMAEGGGIGAGIGSIIPGVGTVIGGGIGAIGGGLYSERHQIGHALTSGWDDLFGGGGTSKTPVRSPRQPAVHVHVYLDGKEITQSIQKYTKQQAARN